MKEEAKIRPSYKDIHIILAKELFEMQRDEEAIKVLQNSIKKIPDQTAAHRLLVNYHLTKKNTNAAMDVVDDSLARSSNGNLLLLKAELLIKTKRNDEAVQLISSNMGHLKEQKTKTLELLSQVNTESKEHGKSYFQSLITLKELAKGDSVVNKRLKNRSVKHKSAFLAARQSNRISVAS